MVSEMKKVILTLYLLIFILPLFFCELQAHEKVENYILLNNDTVISGKILNFYQGFLYIKQKTQILKISPMHFKGIFSNKIDAIKTSAMLKKFPTLIKNAAAGKKNQHIFSQKSNIAAIIPAQLIRETYIAAQKIINSEQKVNKLHTAINERLTNSQAILDNKLFKDLLILASLADKYGLVQSIHIQLRSRELEGLLSDLDISTQTLIAKKTEIIYYFLQHPVTELQTVEEPELIE